VRFGDDLGITIECSYDILKAIRNLCFFIEKCRQWLISKRNVFSCLRKINNLEKGFIIMALKSSITSCTEVCKFVYRSF